MLTFPLHGWHDRNVAPKANNRAQQAALHQSVLEGWLNAQCSPNTRAAYRIDLEAFGEWCAHAGASPITADTAALVAFQAAREVAGDSAATLRRRWSALSSFYDFVIEREMRFVNPALGVDRPKVQSGNPSTTVRLSKEAVATCQATASLLDPRLEALVALLVHDGLKVGEALALNIDDLTGRTPATMITIRGRGEPNQLLLHLQSARAVRQCVAKRRAGPIFVSERTSKSDKPDRLTRFGADHLIRQLRTDETTQQVTANALRRFHFTTRRESGDVLDDVRRRAGLSDVRGVQRYVDDWIEARDVSNPTTGTSPRGLRPTSP
jgi:integrase/recombinase XerD